MRLRAVAARAARAAADGVLHARAHKARASIERTTDTLSLRDVNGKSSKNERARKKERGQWLYGPAATGLGSVTSGGLLVLELTSFPGVHIGFPGQCPSPSRCPIDLRALPQV